MFEPPGIIWRWKCLNNVIDLPLRFLLREVSAHGLVLKFTEGVKGGHVGLAHPGDWNEYLAFQKLDVRAVLHTALVDDIEYCCSVVDSILGFVEFRRSYFCKPAVKKADLGRRRFVAVRN